MSCFTNPLLCPSPGDTENNLLAKILQSLNAGGGVAGVASIRVNGGAFQTGVVNLTIPAGGGTVTSVNGDPGPAVSLDSGEVPEGANLYFTNARAIASTLTGFVAGAGVVTAADSILTAFQKSSGVTNDLLNFRDTNAHADASIYINSGATEIVKVIGASSFISLTSERLQRNIDSGKLALLGGISKTTGAYIEAHGDTSATIGHILLTTKGRASGSEGNLQIFNSAVGSAAADIRAAMAWEGNWAFTPTWNNVATVFTGLQINVTDTTSAATSLLLDLQVGAVSRFNVAKTGALRISGSAAATALIHASTDTTATGLTIFEQASADTDSYDLSFRKTRGTVAIPIAITSGDTLGNVMFRGYSGAAGYVTAASIRAVSSGTIATTRVASSLVFATGTDAAPTVLTDRMTILSTGFIGIGTAIPQGQLSVMTQAGVYESLVDSANYSRLLLSTPAGNHLVQTQAIGTGTLRILQVGTGPKAGTDIAGISTVVHGGQSTGTGLGGLILFQTSPAAGSTGAGVNALVTAAVLTSAGNFGVGTTSPQAKFHSSFADGQYPFGLSGTTKGLRVLTDATSASIQGVDNTLSGSYQPLTFAGTILIFQTNGITEAMRISSTGLVSFQGTSSSFPALKRSSAELQVRLADDSAFGNFSCAAITMAVAAKFSVTSGTNQRAGNATLVGGTVTVSNTTVTANTTVMLTRKTSGGTIGTAITYTVSAATSFTINSDNILDTSTFSYFLIEVP